MASKAKAKAKHRRKASALHNDFSKDERLEMNRDHIAALTADLEKIRKERDIAEKLGEEAESEVSRLRAQMLKMVKEREAAKQLSGSATIDAQRKEIADLDAELARTRGELAQTAKLQEFCAEQNDKLRKDVALCTAGIDASLGVVYTEIMPRLKIMPSCNAGFKEQIPRVLHSLDDLVAELKDADAALSCYRASYAQNSAAIRAILNRWPIRVGRYLNRADYDELLRLTGGIGDDQKDRLENTGGLHEV